MGGFLPWCPQNVLELPWCSMGMSEVTPQLLLLFSELFTWLHCPPPPNPHHWICSFSLEYLPGNHQAFCGHRPVRMLPALSQVWTLHRTLQGSVGRSLACCICPSSYRILGSQSLSSHLFFLCSGTPHFIQNGASRSVSHLKQRRGLVKGLHFTLIKKL